MKALRIVFFFASLTMVLSQNYFARQMNDLTTSERFLNDLHTVIHDLQDSTVLKKKAAIDAVTAVVRAKIGILKGVKDTDNHVVKTVVEIELTTIEAINAAKRAFLKTFASKMMSLIEKLPADKLSELMQLPLFDFVADRVLTLLTEEDVLINKNAGTSVDDNNLLKRSSSSRHHILASLRNPSLTPYRSSSTTSEAPPVWKA